MKKLRNNLWRSVTIYMRVEKSVCAMAFVLLFMREGLLFNYLLMNSLKQILWYYRTHVACVGQRRGAAACPPTPPPCIAISPLVLTGDARIPVQRRASWSEG